MMPTYTPHATYISPNARADFLAPSTDRDVVILAPLLDEGGIDFADFLRETLAEMPPDRLFVLRLPSASYLNRLSEPNVTHALGKRTVLALALRRAAGIRMELSAVGAHSADQPTIAPADVGRLEVEGILRATGAVEVFDRAHLELPSGHHAEGIIRPGRALTSPAATRRIADWVESSLPPSVENLICDHGSLLPIPLEINARRDPQDALCIQSLETYPVDILSIHRAMSRFPRPHRKTAGLISVNGSGGLATRLQNAVGDRASLVTVCDASGGRLHENTLSSIPLRSWPPIREECEPCSMEEPVFAVDPQTFEVLRFTAPKKKFDLKRVAEANTGFWKAVSETAAVTLHGDGQYWEAHGRNPRHLAVRVSVERLLSDAEFCSSCHAALEQVDVPDLILLLDSPAADALEELVRSRHWGVPVVRIKPNSLSEEALVPIQQARRVLVVDDAVVTGHTLFEVRSLIYKATQQHGDPDVSAFIPLMRPSSEQSLQLTTGRWGRQIHWAKRVLLPTHCPWCQEKTVLSFAIAKGALAEEEAMVLSDRFAELEPNSLLYPCMGDPDPDALAQGSVFGTVLRDAATAAAMSAAQEVVCALGPQPGEYHTLDLERALAFFYETSLAAAVLRVTTPIHVLFSEHSPHVRELVYRLLSGDEAICDGMEEEILYAGLRGIVGAHTIVQAVERRRKPLTTRSRALLAALRNLRLPDDTEAVE